MNDKLSYGLTKGDTQSQSAVYNKYRDKLIGLCISLGVSKDNAEDIVHDAFIKVFEKADTLKDKSLVESWISTIVRREVYDNFKNRQLINEGDISEFMSLISDSLDWEYQLLLKDEVSRLLSNLPKRMEEVIRLYDFEGYDHDEIGMILRISPGTSKSQLKRARDKCKDRIEQWRGTRLEKKRRPVYTNKLSKKRYLGKYANKPTG